MHTRQLGSISVGTPLFSFFVMQIENVYPWQTAQTVTIFRPSFGTSELQILNTDSYDVDHQLHKSFETKVERFETM